VSHKIEVMGLSITLTYIKHDRLKLNANVQSTTRLATPIGTKEFLWSTKELSIRNFTQILITRSRKSLKVSKVHDSVKIKQIKLVTKLDTISVIHHVIGVSGGNGRG
jgi:hypothetical protein